MDVRWTFDDFPIVEGEFMWKSSTYLLEKLVERSTQDRAVVFLLFTPLYDSRRECRHTLWPLGGCESSRLFKGWFLSSPHRAGANFPPGRRNRCMNRVDCNYGAESTSWILSTEFLRTERHSPSLFLFLSLSLTLSSQDPERRWVYSHLTICWKICRWNNSGVLHCFTTSVAYTGLYRSGNFQRTTHGN